MAAHRGAGRRRQSLVVAVAVLMCAGTVSADFFSFFLGNQPRFSGDKLYTYEAGLEDLSGHVGALGDFNADKYTDVFWISNDKLTVSVYLWNHGSYSFRASDAKVTVSGSGVTIANVVPGDYNHDGRLDLLVFTEAAGAYTATVYVGDLDTLVVNPAGSPVASLKDEALVADVNGDMFPDLFTADPTDATKWKKWINSGEGSFTENSFTGSGKPMAVPHSNAIVDLNGDCKADLFVKTGDTTNYNFELWVNADGGFTKSGSFPMGGAELQYSTVTFGDFDGDGSLDMVYPTCKGTNCATESQIHIVYNVQQTMCSSTFTSSSSTCRPQTDLCEDKGFDFSGLSQTGGGTEHVIISTAAFMGGSLQPGTAAQPITLRVGDIDMDGYPDILVPVLSGGKKYVQLWSNVGCNGWCTAGATKAGRRSFEPAVSSDFAALSNVENVVAATMFDFDEAGGPLDLMMIIDDGSTRSVRTAFNNMYTDAFYLQALGLGGVCVEWCPSGDRFPDPRPYGVSMPGITYRYTVTDIQGSKSMKQAAQLTQSSHLALQLPYARMGLGRTSNYVEDFFVGTTINAQSDTRGWTSIIPNSQLIVSPYEPDHAGDWTLYLYINPSSKTIWVTFFVISSILVMCVVIACLSWREKKQDEREKKEMAHVFSFDAL